VQNTDETNLRAQPFGVGHNFEHGGRAGAEKQVIQNPGVAQAERVQLMRQSKYDVEVRHTEQFLFSRSELALASLCLALRTVPVPAGIIRDGLITASGTSVDVPSQRRRGAAGDGPQHAQLLVVQPWALVHEAIALLAE
jgi:hypothetical protein